MCLSIQPYKPIGHNGRENKIAVKISFNIQRNEKTELHQVKVDVTEILYRTKEGTQIYGTGHPDV